MDRGDALFSFWVGLVNNTWTPFSHSLSPSLSVSQFSPFFLVVAVVVVVVVVVAVAVAVVVGHVQSVPPSNGRT